MSDTEDGVVIALRAYGDIEEVRRRARDAAAMGMVVFDQARSELVRALGRGREAKPVAMAAMRGLLFRCRKDTVP